MSEWDDLSEDFSWEDSSNLNDLPSSEELETQFDRLNQNPGTNDFSEDFTFSEPEQSFESLDAIEGDSVEFKKEPVPYESFEYAPDVSKFESKSDSSISNEKKKIDFLVFGKISELGFSKLENFLDDYGFDIEILKKQKGLESILFPEISEILSLAIKQILIDENVGFELKQKNSNKNSAEGMTIQKKVIGFQKGSKKHPAENVEIFVEEKSGPWIFTQKLVEPDLVEKNLEKIFEDLELQLKYKAYSLNQPKIYNFRLDSRRSFDGRIKITAAGTVLSASE